MRPRKSNDLLTTNIFSIRCLCNKLFISSSLAPSNTVTSLSFGVIMADTGDLRLGSNRTSRAVTIPTNTPFSSTGTPDIL